MIRASGPYLYLRGYIYYEKKSQIFYSIVFIIWIGYELYSSSHGLTSTHYTVESDKITSKIRIVYLPDIRTVDRFVCHTSEDCGLPIKDGFREEKRDYFIPMTEAKFWCFPGDWGAQKLSYVFIIFQRLL